MRRLDLHSRVAKFLRTLDSKQFRQVVNKVFSLMSEPNAADSALLKGGDGLWRVDIGEYRVVYRFDDSTVFIVVIGKRNDDEGYRHIDRLN